MLDEVLSMLPGLRRLRSMNAPLLRILLDRRPGTCTWCGVVIGSKLKGRTWCGDRCVTAFQSRCCPNTARKLVIKRDGGVCRRCGRDTREAEHSAKVLGLIAHPSHRHGETQAEYEERKETREAALFNLGFARGVWREVDHVLPVTEYGGLCDISQLQLLCGTCHLAETNALAERLKKARAAARAGA